MSTTQGRTGSTRPPPPAQRAGSRTQTRAASSQPRPGQRRIVRRNVTVRRVDPFSVLKLSLIFYFCTLLVIMLGLAMFWSVVNRLGIIEDGLSFLADFNLDVTINGSNIARAVFLIGLTNVVLLSGINVFLAFLYNLVADLLGGFRMTLAEEERAE